MIVRGVLGGPLRPAIQFAFLAVGLSLCAGSAGISQSSAALGAYALLAVVAGYSLSGSV